MKWPSSRNSRPNGTESWTSTAWYFERKRSKHRDERTKKPHSSVIASIIAPSGRTSPAPGAPPLRSAAILAAAHQRVEAGSPRLERGFQRAEQLLGFLRVVVEQVADVDVDRHEAVLWPRVDRHVRFGEQHRSGDALRLELVEAVADRRQLRRGDRLEAKRAQRRRVVHLGRVRRAVVPFPQQMDAVHRRTSPKKKMPRSQYLGSRAIDNRPLWKRHRIIA